MHDATSLATERLLMSYLHYPSPPCSEGGSGSHGTGASTIWRELHIPLPRCGGRDDNSKRAGFAVQAYMRGRASPYTVFSSVARASVVKKTLCFDSRCTGEDACATRCSSQ